VVYIYIHAASFKQFLKTHTYIYTGSIAASMTTLQRHIRDMQDLVKREMSSEKRQEGKE
jgi:Uri superfamily endonuclease